MDKAQHVSTAHAAARAALVPLIVAMILLAHFILALSASATKSLTFDEPLHMVSGVSYWRYNDYRNQPENGNLSQRIIALPLWLLPGFPQGLEQNQYWQKSSPAAASATTLFAPAVDHHALALRGRAMIGLVSVVLGIVVFLAAKRLWKTTAALVSLTLYASHPIVLANAGLMTSDVTAALFFTLTTWALWACLQKLTLARAIGLAACAGGMALAKFSFPLFFPVALAMAAATLARKRPWRVRLAGMVNGSPTHRGQRFFVLVGLVSMTVVSVWLLIWAAYGFRFEAFNPALATAAPAAMQNPWESLLTGQSTLKSILAFCMTHQLFPEAFLYGVAVVAGASSRSALFFGHVYPAGNIWFYPGLFLVKTQLTTLLLLAAALAGIAIRATIRKPGGLRMRVMVYRAWPWLMLTSIYTAMAMSSSLNIGVRHILPALPALFILAGFVGSKRFYPRPQKLSYPRHMALVATLLIISAAVCFTNWPNYIAYFNPVAGNSRTLYQRFGDSNLDWGQDLPGLAKWAESNGYQNGQRPDGQRLFVAYFGSANLKAYGLPGERGVILPGFFTQPDMSPPPFPYGPGDYAISASLLATTDPWTQKQEAKYQELKMVADVLAGKVGISHELQRRRPPVDEHTRLTLLHLFEKSRFNRLCAFLKQREPNDQIGGSINVYRLTNDDLYRYFAGPMRHDLISAD